MRMLCALLIYMFYWCVVIVYVMFVYMGARFFCQPRLVDGAIRTCVKAYGQSQYKYYGIQRV